MNPNHRLRYIKQRQIFDAIAKFDPKHAVTRGEYYVDVQCLKQDVEWNHMDQLHRPFVHNTYHDNLRIAVGKDFATSLTRWGRWPFLITVADVRVEEGLFYQELVLAGVLFIHNIISMEEVNDRVRLKAQWIINSHRFLKPLHKILDRMFYKLNDRLQVEDEPIRSQRYRLRKAGYSFTSDPPDYYTSNTLTNNTIYPPLPDNATIPLTDLPLERLMTRSVGVVEFVLMRKEKEVLIWPSACPHEGGEMAKGTLDEKCRLECPWHGLKFSAASLSAGSASASIYGFEYLLENDSIRIRSIQKTTEPPFLDPPASSIRDPQAEAEASAEMASAGTDAN